MGVKHFYLWYRNNFKECLTTEPQRSVDILAIDLNGLFHLCAQKVYRYGNVSSHLLYKKGLPMKKIPTNPTLLFREICDKIDTCRRQVKPTTKLLLCVDGVAGLGKMNQQRQRRFRSALTMKDAPFNPSAFTPGTKLMDHLTKYIDWYIRMMMTHSDEWKSLQVIFSNEKVPGEGEHKIMTYFRNHVKRHETVCIYGLDADLIMLGMLLPIDHVIVAREPEYGLVEFVDVGHFKLKILELMKWNSDPNEDGTSPPRFCVQNAITDFVMLGFLVGNDFLPTVPTISIMDGAMDLILTLYHQIGRIHGHLTKKSRARKSLGVLQLQHKALHAFFEAFAACETGFLEKKYSGTNYSFYPDPLVVKNLVLTDPTMPQLDFPAYANDYYQKKFSEKESIQDIVWKYLDGMEWVVNYYANGIPDWTWFFPYLYGPFLRDLSHYTRSHRSCSFEQHAPVPPFLQLLAVLPASSKDLVPQPFHSLMNPEHSPLSCYFPTSFEIDLTGKRKEWEGIVCLPPIHIQHFIDAYDSVIHHISPQDRKRNIIGKNFIYQYCPHINSSFSSYYGNIDQCPLLVEPILF